MEYNFADYKALSAEVYFPMRISITHGEGSDGSEMRAQEATCGKEVAAEDISVGFPSGMKVRVLPGGTEATIP